MMKIRAELCFTGFDLQNYMAPMSFSPLIPPAIQNELDAGERVTWMGQPDSAHMSRRALPGAIFGVFLLGFITFWMWGATTPLRTQLGAGKTPDLIAIAFPAFGLLAIGFAVLMIFSPLLERQKVPRTFYALTDKRAIIVIENSKTQSVMPSEFSLVRNDKSNGRSDLILKCEKQSQRGRYYAAEEI